MTIASNISGSKKRQIHDAIRQAVSAKLANLDGPAGDRLLTKLDALKTHVVTGVDKLSAAAPPKPSVLKLVDDNVQLDAVASHDPRKFYKTRKGLWVSDYFMANVLSKAKAVENLGPLSLKSRELTKNAHDREITPELGEDYIFDESEICARIEQMIAKQPNGEKGDLLNNGYANIFYVAGYVVSVLWSAVVREWYVSAWKLDVGYWRAGRRAFSRN